MWKKFSDTGFLCTKVVVTGKLTAMGLVLTNPCSGAPNVISGPPVTTISVRSVSIIESKE